MGMVDDMLRILEEIRTEMNRPLRLSSAFRCQTHNNKISEVKNGAHTVGKAVDVLISGADALRLIDIARKHGISGLGLQQRDAELRLERGCQYDKSVAHVRPAVAIRAH
jgi:uncharacterized protein YcbK (DUF882 family)